MQAELATVIDGQGIADHYDKATSEVYHSTVFETDEEYKLWLQKVTLDKLQMSEEHSLADVGGGSGEFSAALRSHQQFKKLLLVEPSADMIFKETKDGKKLQRCPQVDQPIVKTAGDWGVDCDDEKLDRIMIKFAVHHIPNWEEVFKTFRTNKLAANGRVVILTRNKTDIDYPFFEAAK